MVTSPVVDVNIPLLGWTYIGGPSLHVLVALRDDDEVLLGASEAADSDDLDAVIGVLAQDGPRSAPSFVGVHLGDLTRVVVHGTTWVEVESPQGRRILTPPSARVWLDLDLEGQVDVVRLRGGALPAQVAAMASSSPTSVAPTVPTSGPARSPAPPTAGSTPAPAVAVLPTGANSGGPRGWLSERDDAPSPAATADPPPAAAPAAAPTDTARPDPGPPDSAAPDGPAAAFPAPPTRSFLDALPSWSDHLPVLAGVPPAGVAVPEPRRSAPPETVPQSPLGDAPVLEAFATPRQISAATPAAPAAEAAPAEAAIPAPDVVEHTLTALPSDVRPGSLPLVVATPEPGAARSVPAAEPAHAHEADAAAPTEVGYDHLFGRTVDRDAYLAKLVALGERADESDEDDGADEPVLIRPPAEDRAARPLRARERPTGLDRGVDPKALPQVLLSSDPTSPGSSAGGGSLPISSVPWAARTEPSGPGAPFVQPPPAPMTTPPPTTSPARPALTAPAPTRPARDVSPVPPHPGASPGPVAPGIPATPVSSRPTTDATPTPGAGPQFYSGRSALVPAPTGPHTAITSIPVPGPARGPAVSTDTDDDPADRGSLLAHDPATGPSVLGVLCPSGHPNPPANKRCRRCSLEITEQRSVTMPRPSLGFLRLPTGDVVTLDRGVVLGRAPKPPLDVPAASRPHVVRVASPRKDVSRTHLEVVLDGWQVLVRDLDATNGTTVRMPGRPPVRLRPAEQQVIEPGTVISLADEVELTFEVGP